MNGERKVLHYLTLIGAAEVSDVVQALKMTDQMTEKETVNAIYALVDKGLVELDLDDVVQKVQR
jgi:predicted transcriptional regulator